MDDEANVAWFFNAIDDLVIGVMRSVGLLGVSKRECDAGEFFAEFRQLVRIFACCDLELCPFAPEVEVAGIFQHVCDVGTADAAGDLEQEEFAGLIRLQKFPVRYAAFVFERHQERSVHRLQLFAFARSIRRNERRKYAAMMRHIEWRRAVLANARSDDLALFYYGIDVKNLALDKSLYQELRRMIAPSVAAVEVVKHIPDLTRSMTFSDAERGDFVPRLDDPRCRNRLEIIRDLSCVESPDEFGTRNSVGRRKVAHCQFVAKTPQIRARHARQLEMFACKSCSNNVEFVQPDDLVNWAFANNICRRSNIIAGLCVIRNGLRVVDRRPRPRFVEQLFTRDERDVPAGVVTFLDKLAALKITRDNDDILVHKPVLASPHTETNNQSNKLHFELKEWHNLAVKTIDRRFGQFMDNVDVINLVSNLVAYLVVLLLAISAHECGHAWMSWKYGDDTAYMLGRVTLNPVAHTDPVGTLLIPIVSFVVTFTTGSIVPLIGWGIPTPVNPRNWSKYKQANVMVSIAGILANLILAVIGFVIFKTLLETGVINLRTELDGMYKVVAIFLNYLIMLNVSLAVFNLLPFPPLDGSKVLSTFLPASFQPIFDMLEQWGFLILIVLVYMGIVGAIMYPFYILVRYLLVTPWF